MHKIEHIGVVVKDAERSINFYCKGLGFKVIDDHQDEKTRLVFLDLQGQVVELIQYLDGHKEERGMGIVDHIAFRVEDMESALEKVLGLGSKLLMDAPRQVGDKKIMFFTGPDGERLEFCAKA